MRKHDTAFYKFRVIIYFQFTAKNNNMSDIFQSSKSLIEQAKESVNNFERRYAEFIESEPIALIGEIDDETSEQVHKVKLVKQMPDVLSEIAFDVVNALRSALDEAVSPESENKSASFPFAESESDFEKILEEKYKYLPVEIVEVLRSFKPYKGGNNLLCALLEASRADKNSLVCPIAVTRGGTVQVKETFSTDSYLPELVWDRTKNEMEIFREPQGVESEGNFDISYFIAMRDIEFIDGEPADVVLKDFINIVEDILNALEYASR